MGNNKRIQMVMVEEQNLATHLDRHAFKASGIDAAYVGTKEALQTFLSQQPVDVVCVNSDNPNLDTFSILETLKGANVPALVMGVQIKPSFRDLYLSKGAVDAIELPLPRNILIERIKGSLQMNIRQRERVSTELISEVAIKHKGKSFLGEAGNLSAEGMYLLCEQDLNLDTVIELRFSIATAHKPFKLRAKVTRVDSVRKGEHLEVEGMGIRFVTMDQKDRDRIEEFVGEHSEELSNLMYYI